MDNLKKERLPDEYYDEEIQERDHHVRKFLAGKDEEAFADGYAAKVNRAAVERAHGMPYEAVEELRLIRERKERQERQERKKQEKQRQKRLKRQRAQGEQKVCSVLV